MRQFCLDKYRRNITLPLLHEKFLINCLPDTENRENRGLKAKTCQAQKEIDQFHNTEFEAQLSVPR